MGQAAETKFLGKFPGMWCRYICNQGVVKLLTPCRQAGIPVITSVGVYRIPEIMIALFPAIKLFKKFGAGNKMACLLYTSRCV